MVKNFHSKQFDEGTQVKLELLRLYLKSWIPVFIEKKEAFWKEIYIYDFFAGEGMDIKGSYGSPLLILDEIKNYCPTIVKKGFKVKFLINEYNSKKNSILKSKIDYFFESCRKKQKFSCCAICNQTNECPFDVNIKQEDFQTLFNYIFPDLITNNYFPRFMFIDQFGIKQVTNEIFSKLTSLKRTDFLFFISSSFVRRFSELSDFQKYLDLSREVFDENKPDHCHRIILDYYRKVIPKNKTYFLAPFSIKKGSNIYGLIFGSNHPLGMEKYLDAAWKIDKNTGEANYNIDDDSIIKTPQLSIFSEDNIVKKLDVFKKKLENWLKNSTRTNEEIYLFAILNGMRKIHANNILKDLYDNNKLDIIGNNIKKGSFYLSYKPQKLIKINFNE